MAQVTVYQAAAVRDAVGTNHRPGTVVVQSGRIVFVGPPDRVIPHDAAGKGPGGEIREVDASRLLILPAMVNAHAHLDLTDLGPRPYGGDFIAWVGGIVRYRAMTQDKIIASVNRGVAMLQTSGVGWVGDIAGSPDAAQTLGRSGFAGVSFLETFGLGLRQAEYIALLRQRMGTLSATAFGANLSRSLGQRWQLGIAPHAPYSTGPEVYAAAGDLAEQYGYPLSTHLAETPQELEFVREATGPFANWLRTLSKWDDTIRGSQRHPVEWLGPHLIRRPWLLAHCNHVSDEHLALLAQCRASVAYCPVASDYFGQPERGGHRYREMIEAGINVCLGTDSILCQPPEEPQPLGILPQMRHLHRRDRTDPQTLLAMATVNGLRALDLSPGWATLRPGAPANLIGIPIDVHDPTDPLTQALRNDYAVGRIGD